MTIKIGITGSMGMGKTTVSLMFKKNGIKVWNGDIEVLLNYMKMGMKGTKKYYIIISVLKDEIEIDREKVSSNLIRQKIDWQKLKNNTPFIKKK